VTMKLSTLKTCTLAVMLLGLDAPVLSGTGVAQGVDPAELVRDIHAIFGEHHARAVHSKGVVLNATWRASSPKRVFSQANFKQRYVYRIRPAYPRFPMPTPMPALMGSR